MPKRRLVIKGQEPPAPAPKSKKEPTSPATASQSDLGRRQQTALQNLFAPSQIDPGGILVDPDTGGHFVIGTDGERIPVATLGETLPSRLSRIPLPPSRPVPYRGLPGASERNVSLVFTDQSFEVVPNEMRVNSLDGYETRTLQLSPPELNFEWRFTITGGPLPDEMAERMTDPALASLILNYLLHGNNG